MADILNAAQGNNSALPTSPPTDDLPMAPVNPPPESQPSSPDVLPPEPPPSPEETESMSPTSPSDSLIVPPKQGNKPTEPAHVQEKSSPPPPIAPLRKKKSATGVILTVLLLLLITLPLAVFFITQQKEQADIRSRASASCVAINANLPQCVGIDCVGRSTPEECLSAGICCDWNSVYPPTIPTLPTCGDLTQTCSPVGAECITSVKLNHYCCVVNTNYKLIWAPNTWGTGKCPTSNTPVCPWPEGANGCCPTGGDACDYNAGQTKCIGDPFNSNCQKWGDGTCPGGGGVWIASHWYTDCKTEGCGGNPDLVCVDNAGGSGVNLCRNKNCLQDTDCICAGTPTPTPKPSAPQCNAIKIYKGTTVVTDPTTLQPGDQVTLAVAGSGATKAHFRINGGAFQETSTKNPQGEYLLDVTLEQQSSTSAAISIEAEIFGTDGKWH